jgi:hypothetical protein
MREVPRSSSTFRSLQALEENASSLGEPFVASRLLNQSDGHVACQVEDLRGDRAGQQPANAAQSSCAHDNVINLFFACDLVDPPLAYPFRPAL